MRSATTAAQMLVRIAGLLLVVLGVLLWTGNAPTLVIVHILLGLALVLALWTLAVLAARAGVPRGLFAWAIAWGLLVALLGLTQERLLEGDAHWTIQVLHLLVGLGAIALAEGLGARIKRRLAEPAGARA